MNTLYDVNTFIGHWPFRQLTNATPVELQNLLQTHDISRALVANINSIFYKDAQCGNQELFELIADRQDFYVGVAIINPTYAAWKRDFEKTVIKFNFKALRLVPQYHNYKIGDTTCRAICHKAAELKIPVIISPSMVDVRQKHWLDIGEIISFKQICYLAESIDKLKIICSGFNPEMSDFDYQAIQTYSDRILWDTSRCMQSSFFQVLAYGVNKIGAEQFLYGSNAPLRDISPSILALQCADISQSEKLLITQRNFNNLFTR